jgi:hypothetical protein
MIAYPRTHTIIILVICGITVTSVAMYVYGDFFSPSHKNELGAVEVVPTSISDANQLVETAGWKDTFFNVTDKNNLYGTTSSKNSRGNSPREVLTATDLFGREFFSKFMTLRQAGMVSNSDAKEALVNQVIESGQLITDSPKVYSLVDLNISNTEDNITRQVYANNVAKTIKNHQPRENEGVIAKEALETGDANRLADIDPIIIAYSSVRSDLLDISVPSSLASYHLNLVNGMSEAVANALSLRNTLDDPLQTLSTLSRYQTTEKNFFNTVVDMRTYFNNNSIIFSPTEIAFSIFSLK